MKRGKLSLPVTLTREISILHNPYIVVIQGNCMGGDWQGDDSIEKSLGIRSVIKKLRSQREEKNRDLAISFSNKYIVPRIEEKVSNGANSFSMELKNRMKTHLVRDRGGPVPYTDSIYFYEILLEMLKDEGLKVSYPKKSKSCCKNPQINQDLATCRECGGKWKKMRAADLPARLTITWKP